MISNIFNLNMLFPEDKIDLRKRFESATPYPHAVLPEAISPVFAQHLFHFLESSSYQWRRVKESFYEHQVCNLSQLSLFLGGPLTELLQALQDPLLIQRLCEFVGSPPTVLMSLTGHRLYHGDHIDTHNDYNTCGEIFRLLMFIDPKPKFSGGELLLLEEKAGKLIIQKCVPYLPFQVYLFRFGEHSHHAVTPIREHLAGANRLTLLATYGKESV